MPHARPSISDRGPAHEARPSIDRPGCSSKPMPWPCSPRPPCTMSSPGAPGERYQVVVHVDAAVLTDPNGLGQSEIEEMGHVPAGTSQRLACDASRVVMRHDQDGRAVEIGARTRTIPPALRRALLHRDRTCRFPGCSSRLGEGHHIQHWAQGGPPPSETSCCSAVVITQPDGHVLPDVAPATVAPVDPVSAL